jgi:hypothetical protein
MLSVVSSLTLSDDQRIAKSLLQLVIDEQQQEQEKEQEQRRLKIEIDCDVSRNASSQAIDSSVALWRKTLDDCAPVLSLVSLSLHRLVLTQTLLGWIGQLLQQSQFLECFSICAYSANGFQIGNLLVRLALFFFLNGFRSQHCMMGRQLRARLPPYKCC